MATIKDLEKYPKERILNAIDKCLWIRKTDVINELLDYLKNEDYRNERKKSIELEEKWQNAYNEWVKSRKEYKDFMWKVAEKYNIINKETNTYRFGDWIDNATEQEYNEALRLENAQKEWFEKYEKYEKELDL